MSVLFVDDKLANLHAACEQDPARSAALFLWPTQLVTCKVGAWSTPVLPGVGLSTPPKSAPANARLLGSGYAQIASHSLRVSKWEDMISGSGCGDVSALLAERATTV